MEQNEFLDHYQQQLMQKLLRLTTSAGALDGQLLETDDLDEQWNDIASAYMVDAVPEIPNYPHVALGWMMYVGMAIAHFWDDDWERILAEGNLYARVCSPRGFDNLDEYVREEVLELERDSPAFRACEDLVRSCAQTALDLIRRESIAPQDPTAFHIYTRSLAALFKIGAAVELKRLGYKWEAMAQ